MKRDSFIFYKSFYEAIKTLDDHSKLQVYDAICEFSLTGKTKELEGIANTVFILIKPQLEANVKRYQNGTKGGRPKTKTKPKDNQNKTKPKANKNVNVNNNKNVNKKEYFSDNEINELFYELLEIRKKKKAVNTDRALSTIINKLNKETLETQKQMLLNAIEGSWKTVYPLNNNFKSKDESVPEWFDKEKGATYGEYKKSEDPFL